VLSVTFHEMALKSLEEALSALEEARPLSLMLSLLSIKIPWSDVNATRLASLLRIAVRLSPRELVFTDNYYSMYDEKHTISCLPCFPHATVIEMSFKDVCFTTLPAGEFSALRKLSLSGLHGSVDIGALVARCPCLRELKVSVATGNITVHSALLEKLDVFPRDLHTECHGVDIATPMLRQLHLRIDASKDIGVSVSAPSLEKVCWEHLYTTPLALVFGSWRLHSMTVKTVDNRDDTCLRVQQPPPYYALSLHLRTGVSLFVCHAQSTTELTHYISYYLLYA
jgi:hypothetical protein